MATKTLYHSALRDMGPTRVTVKKDCSESTKKKGTFYTTLVVNNEERYYNPENQQCLDFWMGKTGQTFTVVAVGTRDDADIQFVGQEGTEIAAPGAVASAAAAPAIAPRLVAPQQPHVAQQQIAPRVAGPATAAKPNGTKWQPLGATVGMAVNNACASLTAQGLPLTPKEVWEVASDIICVARRLEQGSLAEPWSVRNKEPKPATAPQPPLKEQYQPSDNDGGAGPNF